MAREWKAISKSLLVLLMLIGGFAGFSIFESWAWFYGRQMFDFRSLKSEIATILTGLSVGLMAGIILDFYSIRHNVELPFPILCSLLIIGFVVFLIVRIAVQPAL